MSRRLFHREVMDVLGGGPPLTEADTEAGLTQPDQVCEVFQALDPLNDVVVQLQLLQVLKLPEVIYAEDI